MSPSSSDEVELLSAAPPRLGGIPVRERTGRGAVEDGTSCLHPSWQLDLAKPFLHAGSSFPEIFQPRSGLEYL